MKILIFNVKFSPNLGDGVLAECLEAALKQNGCDIEVETLDLAGRQAYGAAGRGRKGALAILDLLPAPMRRTVVAFVLKRRLRRLRGAWQARIEAADAVVIGGGNLFQDDDLNFPLKLATVLNEARRAERPVAVFAVGVSGRWSDHATRLFGILRGCRVLYASVRDRSARDNWIAHFGDRYDVEVCPDPGLLACDLLRVAETPPPETSRPLIGLCVTHPLVLRRHANAAGAQIPLLTAGEYRQLVHWLVDAGCKVLLFTNGAGEDQRFLEKILDERNCASLLAAGLLAAAEPPRTPADLVAILQRPGAIIAHRLHACIVSYSLGTPQIGLGWDHKVESFFNSIGREDFFVHGGNVKPQVIGELALKALEKGIDMNAHGEHVRDARKAVACLALQIREAAVEEELPAQQPALAGP